MLMHSTNNNFFIFSPPFINTCSLFAYYHEHMIFAILKANKFSFSFYLSCLNTNFDEILLLIINNNYPLFALYHNVVVYKRWHHNILWCHLKLFLFFCKILIAFFFAFFQFPFHPGNHRQFPKFVPG